MTALILHEIAHHVFSGAVETPEPHELQVAFEQMLRERQRAGQSAPLDTDSAALQHAVDQLHMNAGALPQSSDTQAAWLRQQGPLFAQDHESLRTALSHSGPLTTENWDNAEGGLLTIIAETIDQIATLSMPGVREMRFETRQKVNGVLAKLHVALHFICEQPGRQPNFRCRHGVSNTELFAGHEVVASWLSQTYSSIRRTPGEFAANETSAHLCVDPTRLPLSAQLRPITSAAQLLRVESEAVRVIRDARAEADDLARPFEVVVH